MTLLFCKAIYYIGGIYSFFRRPGANNLGKGIGEKRSAVARDWSCGRMLAIDYLLFGEDAR
jgi:hypothetical protein